VLDIELETPELQNLDAAEARRHFERLNAADASTRRERRPASFHASHGDAALR